MNEMPAGRGMPDTTTELRYVNDRISAILKEELARGERAERKAIQLLSISGAGAAIVIAVFKENGQSDVMTVVFVMAVIVQLAKSAWFSLKTISPRKIYREDPNALAKERKTQDYSTALQADIDLRLWLYNKAVPIHSTILFYVDRAIRNIAGAVFTALFGTVLSILIGWLANTCTFKPEFIEYFTVFISIIVFAWALASDWLIEWIDDKWVFHE